MHKHESELRQLSRELNDISGVAKELSNLAHAISEESSLYARSSTEYIDIGMSLSDDQDFLLKLKDRLHNLDMWLNGIVEGAMSWMK